MRQQAAQKRTELQHEYEHGQTMLANMDRERANLEQTLLRISGAMIVLDQLLSEPDAAQEGGDNGSHQ